MNFSKTQVVGMAAAILLGFGGAALASSEDEMHDDKQHQLEDHQKDYVWGTPAVPTAAWTMSFGGRMYDNWMNVTLADEPEETHPAWPAANTEHEGASTWRCKACHGWDYKGADGVYSSGSYMTGITGVVHMQGSNPDKMVAILRDGTHQYTEEMITDVQAVRIGLFISRGLHDTDACIDRETGEANGSAARGAEYFQNVCAACHGYQGTQLDWGDDDGPAYIGTEANANPWEVLHKIRNGHPGVEMISGRPFGMDAAVDILNYVRTLPES